MNEICPRCGLEREPGDHKLLDTCIRALKHRLREGRRTLQLVIDGFTYDPGHSDLDDEQPIHVRMTLGDWRRANRLLHEVRKV